MQGDAERSALLAEKLQQSKRKNAELRTQITALESQLQQMTQRVQQLHSMHANSAAELVAQTKHACEAAAARLSEEAEQRAKHDLSVARQAAADALEAERSFTTSLVRKVETMQQLFPEEFAQTEQTDTFSNSARASSTLPRNVLQSFFESTRHALHGARHTREQLAEMREELRVLRLRAPLEEAHRFSLQRHIAQMADRVARVQSDLSLPAEGESTAARGALIQQRDDIIAQVNKLQQRIQTARAQRQEAQEHTGKLDASSRGPSSPAARKAASQHSFSPTRSSQPAFLASSLDESGVADDERRDQVPALPSREALVATRALD